MVWLSLRELAIRPISVSCPVATTIARPRPQVTPVPAKTIEDRSAIPVSGATAARAFVTGSDSPVNADSSSSSLSCAETRASAATRSPSRSTSRSPGTTSSTGTSRSRPSRITDAVGWIAFRNASTARSAPASCTKPSTALRTTIAAMTRASSCSPIRNETAVAASSSATSGSAICRAAIARYGGRSGTGSRLAPTSPSRRRAVDSSRPRLRSVAKSRARSASSLECDGTARSGRLVRATRRSLCWSITVLLQRLAARSCMGSRATEHP